MPALLKKFCLVVANLALLACVAFIVPAAAQQPRSVNPMASSVKEEQLLQQAPRIQGRGTIPDVKSYVLEQPAGRDWRQFHQVTLQWVGGIAIIGMLGLLVVFYLIRGMVRIEGGRAGRMIVRFNGFERVVHWMTATCFIILGITGLNISFGKTLLLPLIGIEAFAAWSQWAKYAHNFLSFPFTLGVIVVFLMWVAGMIPSAGDIRWILEGGGIVGSKHLPADRFNGGQKIFYWVVVLGGAAVAATGYLLMFPFYLTDMQGMQIAQIVHSVVAVLFVAAMLAHIYIGTIGMEGAFEGMGSGEVDLNWAKQHHSRWIETELGKGRNAVPHRQAASHPAE